MLLQQNSRLIRSLEPDSLRRHIALVGTDECFIGAVLNKGVYFLVVPAELFLIHFEPGLLCDFCKGCKCSHRAVYSCFREADIELNNLLAGAVSGVGNGNGEDSLLFIVGDKRRGSERERGVGEAEAVRKIAPFSFLVQLVVPVVIAVGLCL